MKRPLIVSASDYMAVADTADRRLDARFSEALSVFYGHVLRTPDAVVDQSAAVGWPPFVQGLFECIEHGEPWRTACCVRLARQPTMGRA